MLTISPVPLTAAGAQQYFRNEVGQWRGAGAADLGLAGNCRAESFEFGCILRGYDTFGNLLVQPSGVEGVIHRAAWQIGWSAPKSISIQALVNGDDRLLQAHTDAAESAFYALEKSAAITLPRGSGLVITGNLVAVSFEHVLARPTHNQLPDPQVHSHYVIANMTHRDDSEWRALRQRQLVRDQRIGTEVYREVMQASVKGLGYDIQTTSAKGEWELAQFNRFHIMAFSQRKQQIERIISEHGWHPHAAGLASIIEREPKRDYELSWLKERWRERAEELGLNIQPAHQQEYDLRPANYEHSPTISMGRSL